MVSSRTAVLPVWRSPMISSRCPRPIGNHGVDGLEAGGHGLAHGLAVDDAGSDALDGQKLCGGDGALVVNRHAQRVDHAADHGRAHRNAQNLAGALDLVAFLDLGVVAQNHGADRILFERKRQARDAVREAEQLAGHNLVEAVQAGNAVTQRGDGPDLVDLDLRVVVRDLFAKKLRNLVCLDLSHLHSSGVRDQGSGISLWLPSDPSSILPRFRFPSCHCYQTALADSLVLL